MFHKINSALQGLENYFLCITDTHIMERNDVMKSCGSY